MFIPVRTERVSPGSSRRGLRQVNLGGKLQWLDIRGDNGTRLGEIGMEIEADSYKREK